MDRKEFLKISAATLTAGSVIAFLDACKKKNDSPKVDFTIDLSTSTYAALNTNGGFVYKDDIIIARTSSGSYIAVSKICTHQSCTVKFDSSNNFPCPCHGSKFDSSGAVLNGPASSPLTKYNTSLSGTMLRVFA